AREGGVKLRLRGPHARFYAIAAGVIVLVFALFVWAPNFLTAIETTLYDLHFTLRGPQRPGDEVVIVAVDGKSLAAVGRSPWPRSTLAKLVTGLSDGGAKVIALDILLSEPEVSGELRVAHELSGRLDARGLSGTREAQTVRHELDALLGNADHD